jgi:hypothetical protein
MVEKIDLAFLEANAQRKSEVSAFYPLKVIHYEFDCVLDDGTELYIGGNSQIGYSEGRTPPLPAYWIEFKRYYPSGIIKEKGKQIKARGRGMKIGVWHYYDESGRLLRRVNYDERFGSFSLEQLLALLVEKEILGENHERIEDISIFYNEENNQWLVGTGGFPFSYDYHIDGHTGEVLRVEEIPIIM